MYYLLLFATLGQACSSLTGQWEVQKGDTIYSAANALQQDYRDIIKLNVKMPYKDLKEGSKYTVPYIEGVSYPATWSTSSCTPVLHLNILTPTSARSSESEKITESVYINVTLYTGISTYDSRFI
uniref:LysM domain-containing protein n=1 Tax=Bionectria ochroleuca TaxID=29856 RepID=A0A0B7KRR2_BIOOC